MKVVADAGAIAVANIRAYADSGRRSIFSQELSAELSGLEVLEKCGMLYMKEALNRDPSNLSHFLGDDDFTNAKHWPEYQQLVQDYGEVFHSRTAVLRAGLN